ncbi:aminotransferase class-III [Roseibium sp. TrichSKD4]|uniref:3-keto-5-aminohexanoate cleavage protein n=1 Tax=Roseibium sp. TrichSKD4 TaxID=744980 RepID=UPI0001E56E58|nr:3-keto-5-aminohexanoate cleavage protein [Roseibium sp. TrichSKD4]EFO32161.1 aminotransferase class-III [Roseibium sp. TrichSKD4]
MTPEFSQPLPQIMVAPNGARRTKADHPQLPITSAETVVVAKACFQAGAGAIHAHVRDENGKHVLDAALYRQLLSDLRAAVPDMYLQITTEAVGHYSPEEQRQLVRDVVPGAVSIAVREMVPDENSAEAAGFYDWALGEEIAVQHILYSPDDVHRFFALTEEGVIPGNAHQVLFVLGRYATNQESAPEDLAPFLDAMRQKNPSLALDWAVCAFGHRETDCLAHAIDQGGKARIGFENGLWNSDGALAKDNADRVRDLKNALIG